MCGATMTMMCLAASAMLGGCASETYDLADTGGSGHTYDVTTEQAAIQAYVGEMNKANLRFREGSAFLVEDASIKDDRAMTQRLLALVADWLSDLERVRIRSGELDAIHRSLVAAIRGLESGVARLLGANGKVASDSASSVMLAAARAAASAHLEWSRRLTVYSYRYGVEVQTAVGQ